MNLEVKTYATNNATKRDPQVYLQSNGYNVARVDVAGRHPTADPEKVAKIIAERVNSHDALLALARDLLARLSQDYGDSENCPPDVEELFTRGDMLVPIV